MTHSVPPTSPRLIMERSGRGDRYWIGLQRCGTLDGQRCNKKEMLRYACVRVAERKGNSVEVLNVKNPIVQTDVFEVRSGLRFFCHSYCWVLLPCSLFLEVRSSGCKPKSSRDVVINIYPRTGTDAHFWRPRLLSWWHRRNRGQRTGSHSVFTWQLLSLALSQTLPLKVARQGLHVILFPTIWAYTLKMLNIGAKPKSILSYTWSWCRHSYSLWRAASGHPHSTRKTCFKCQTKAQPSRTKDTLGQSAYEKNENNLLHESWAESFQEWTSFSGVQCDRNKYHFFNLNDEVRGGRTQEHVLRHKELLDQYTTDALTSDLAAFTQTYLVPLSIPQYDMRHCVVRAYVVRVEDEILDFSVSELSSKSHEGTRRTSLRVIVLPSPAAVIAEST